MEYAELNMLYVEIGILWELTETCVKQSELEEIKLKVAQVSKKIKEKHEEILKRRERKRKQMEEQLKLTKEDIKEKKRRLDEVNSQLKELEKKESAVIKIQAIVRGFFVRKVRAYLVCKAQQGKRNMVEQNKMQVGKAKEGRIASI